MALTSKKGSRIGSGAYKLTTLSKEKAQVPLERKGEIETDQDPDPDPEKTTPERAARTNAKEVWLVAGAEEICY